MKILVVLPYLNKHLGEFILYINNRHDVDFYILGNNDKFREAFNNELKEVNISSLGYYLLLVNLLKRKYSTVIFHGIFYIKIIPIIILLRKSNTYLMSESFNPQKMSWISYFMKRVYVRIFNSRSGPVHLVALGSRKMKIQYKQLGLNFEYFSLSAYLPKIQGQYNERLKLIDGKIRLAFIGQFIERKNIELLIQLVISDEWRRVKGKVEFYFIGEGELESFFIIPDNVKVITNLDNNQVLSQLEKIDVLLLPSFFDGWGAVVNEAISRGCTLLLSEHVGAGEVFLKEGENGYLISVNNYLDIIVRVEQWIQNPLLLERMQNKSFELFKDLHNPETQYKFLN